MSPTSGYASPSTSVCASAVDESQVAEIAEEMEDRFGPPPEEARRLVQLMSLKTELRRLKVLGCEASGRSDALSPFTRGHAARSRRRSSISSAPPRAPTASPRTCGSRSGSKGETASSTLGGDARRGGQRSHASQRPETSLRRPSLSPSTPHLKDRPVPPCDHDTDFRVHRHRPSLSARTGLRGQRHGLPCHPHGDFRVSDTDHLCRRHGLPCSAVLDRPLAQEDQGGTGAALSLRTTSSAARTLPDIPGLPHQARSLAQEGHGCGLARGDSFRRRRRGLLARWRSFCRGALSPAVPCPGGSLPGGSFPGRPECTG